MVQHRRDLDLQPFGYGTGNLPGYSTRAAREATHVTVLLGHAGTQSEWCHAPRRRMVRRGGACVTPARTRGIRRAVGQLLHGLRAEVSYVVAGLVVASVVGDARLAAVDLDLLPVFLLRRR